VERTSANFQDLQIQNIITYIITGRAVIVAACRGGNI